jgi:hypothetical protein
LLFVGEWVGEVEYEHYIFSSTFCLSSITFNACRSPMLSFIF